MGIGAYEHAPGLGNPVNDARAIGEALRKLNFEVDEIYDPSFSQLTHALRDWGIKAQQADVAVVYYAGHGVQVAHENYLIPADAMLEREHDPVYEALSSICSWAKSPRRASSASSCWMHAATIRSLIG